MYRRFNIYLSQSVEKLLLQKCKCYFFGKFYTKNIPFSKLLEMKTRLVLATEKKEIEQWTDLPFIPRRHDWFNVKDIFTVDELKDIKKSSAMWSGEKGVVQSIEYRHDDNDYYIEVLIRCEDENIVS